ncbi:MAG: 50S ribosomal protein L35 [Candidatus Stahlbacteria bacterium]|nr:50S ribosomal protein L35 [candidate division WOR-3 bacterium]TET98034.1 MAG: 50S ribosomal protein L35 [Candidatus Stahlbacteria bacterium]
MPKLKTKGAVKKRFTRTKKGDIRFKRAGDNHLQVKHSNKNKNRRKKDKMVSKADKKKLRRLMH